ncbi:MAG: D-alanyl-D-alanine carboxypeptidase [Pyrinomonadaceae bacterium]
MTRFTEKKVVWLGLLSVLCFGLGPSAVNAQENRKPLFQQITIEPGKTRPRTTPTPLVTKTSSTKPILSTESAATSSATMRKTSFAALASVNIPGYSGILIESDDGLVVLDSYADQTFNPASNVKVATSYTVLKTFGPNYRFKTGVWTDGTIDSSTGTLTGNVYVSGRDPIFNYEHAVSIANELNRLGVTRIEGDLVVTSTFAMNYSQSSSRSASTLLTTMDATKRSSAANRSWNSYIANSGKFGILNPTASVYFSGSSYVQTLPSNARLLFSHESAPLREIVKVMMSYSNNFLAERLGDMLGGAYRVANIVQKDTGAAPYEFNLETCSGLGINRVSPRAQMKLLRKFKDLLKKHNMTFSDVMPVAGLDDGTLKNRYDSDFLLGSVVGKTGTLNRTDRGVSTLSGEITTRQGKFLFVIFNQRGGVGGFRSFQNSFIPLVQSLLGGAMPAKYIAIPLDRRLAQSRVTPAVGGNAREDE